MPELRRLRERARTGRFLHRVEAREGAVQSQWASEWLGKHIAVDGDLADHDRTAVVVSSASVKMRVTA